MREKNNSAQLVDAPFALCPTRVAPPAALELAKVLVARLGARPIVIDAKVHDAAFMPDDTLIVSNTVHLPRRLVRR